MFSSGGPSVRILTRYDGEVSEPLDTENSRFLHHLRCEQGSSEGACPLCFYARRHETCTVVFSDDMCVRKNTLHEAPVRPLGVRKAQ